MKINKLTELSKEVSHLFSDDSADFSNFVSRITMTISHDSAEFSNFISCFTMTICDCGVDHFSDGIANASNFISRFTMTICDCGVDHFSDGIANASNFISRFTMTGGNRFGKEFRPSADFVGNSAHLLSNGADDNLSAVTDNIDELRANFLDLLSNVEQKRLDHAQGSGRLHFAFLMTFPCENLESKEQMKQLLETIETYHLLF